MLETLDYDHNVFNSAAREADKSLAVRLFRAPVRNEEKSVQEGRPIFDYTVMIEIRVRGDRNNVVQRPLRPEDKVRFREAVRAFEQGDQAGNSGTPLSQWPLMTAAQVEELKYLGFHTVENIAEAHEGVLGKFPGLRSMQEKAKLFLEHAKGGAPMERLLKENTELKSQVEVQQRTIQDLSSKMEELTNKFSSLADKLAKK